MAPILTEDECKKVLNDSPQLIKLLIERIKEAQSREDRILWTETVGIKVSSLIQYADTLAAAGSSAIDSLVTAGLLGSIENSLRTEFARFPQEIRWAVSCFCRVLQRSEGEELANTRSTEQAEESPQRKRIEFATLVNLSRPANQPSNEKEAHGPEKYHFKSKFQKVRTLLKVVGALRKEVSRKYMYRASKNKLIVEGYFFYFCAKFR